MTIRTSIIYLITKSVGILLVGKARSSEYTETSIAQDVRLKAQRLDKVTYNAADPRPLAAVESSSMPVRSPKSRDWSCSPSRITGSNIAYL